MTDLIRYEVRRGVATLTLDSPPNRNALSVALIEQLRAALDGAERDDAVRVIVLTHSGHVFSSGADLSETAAAIETGRVPVGRLGDVLAAIWESTKPVVARIGGAARAGGLGLIAAADIAVCARDATFAFTEVRIGVIPAVISATVLPRLDPRAAAEFYLTGESFDGNRAAEIGLVTRPSMRPSWTRPSRTTPPRSYGARPARWPGPSRCSAATAPLRSATTSRSSPRCRSATSARTRVARAWLPSATSAIRHGCRGLDFGHVIDADRSYAPSLVVPLDAAVTLA